MHSQGSLTQVTFAQEDVETTQSIQEPLGLTESSEGALGQPASTKEALGPSSFDEVDLCLVLLSQGSLKQVTFAQKDVETTPSVQEPLGLTVSSSGIGQPASTTETLDPLHVKK